MKKLVIDLDGTLTVDDPSLTYDKKEPRVEVVETLKKYKELGFEIIIATARNMRTHNGNIGKITAHTLPVVLEWLAHHSIPYDEVYIGKPWCGTDGFYVDDKAIRPDEFARMSYEEICTLVGISK
ncbi:HAD hydrolase family protein [Pseudomonas putida]|uniref:LNS2 domain-containing protein n=1 Tax=Pseudomonas putida TaxID=303 RepID=UPI000646E4B5|nr:HAD hydrolase family protein [Pseudomonas putida]